MTFETEGKGNWWIGPGALLAADKARTSLPVFVALHLEGIEQNSTNFEVGSPTLQC